jgi:hypothetical protein
MTDPNREDVADDPCVRRVTAALAFFGGVVQITVLDDAAKTARQAAEALGTDISLSRYDQVWAAAGNPRTVFPASYDELLMLTAGHPAEIA